MTTGVRFQVWRKAVLAVLLLGVLLAGGFFLAGTAHGGAGDKLYWIDDASYSSSTVDRIMRSDLDGSGVEVLLSEDMDEQFALPSLAIDSQRGRVYWTNAATDEIKRAGFDGGNVEVIAQLSQNPQGIAVDSVAGKVYWSTTAFFLTASTIERANLDGSNREVILTPTGATYALAVDTVGGHLYFSSANEVLRANLDGSGVTSLFVAPETPGSDKFVSFIVDLAVTSAGPDVYYTSVGVGGEICWLVPGGEVCQTYDTSSEIGRRLSGGSVESFSSLPGPNFGGVAVAESAGAVFTNHLAGITRSDLAFGGSAQIVEPGVAGVAVDMEVGLAEPVLPTPGPLQPTETPTPTNTPTPLPPAVGGSARSTDLAPLPAAEESAGSATPWIAAAALVGMAVVSGAAWYARRRLAT